MATHDPRQARALASRHYSACRDGSARLPAANRTAIPLEQNYSMPSFDDARELILANVAPLGGLRRVEILDALGRVIAEDIVAPWNMPFCDNSAMDGYAVRESDCTPGARPWNHRLHSAGAVPATAVAPGCAIKIMTGAPIPAGCDAIVPFEEAEESRRARLHQGAR